MTIEELTEKLRDAKGTGGAYSFLLGAYIESKNYKKKAEAAEAAEDINYRLMLRRRRDEKYSVLLGFIWGLYAADFISSDERCELVGGAIDLTYGSDEETE